MSGFWRRRNKILKAHKVLAKISDLSVLLERLAPVGEGLKEAVLATVNRLERSIPENRKAR